MIELPTQKTTPTNFNAQFMILYGKQKAGKSTLMAALDNNLIIDLEDGYRALSALVVQARTPNDLAEIANTIKSKIYKDESGKIHYPYKYITIDNASRLEDMSLPVALSLYKNTPMGKNFTGSDVRTLPQGAGWLYQRTAFRKLVDMFKGLSETLILITHVRDKQIRKDGEEMYEMSPELSGKLSDILSGEADAIGYVYRKENKTIVSFESGDDIMRGARPEHLRNKKIVVAESDDKGTVHVDLSKIFIS